MSSPSAPSSLSHAHPFRSGCYPEILLDQNCLIGYCENPTSATTENSQGLSVVVSFEIRDPPALSLCFACCYDPTGRQRFSGEPRILGVAGGLVLLAISFCHGADSINQWCYRDFFVYRAGSGAPSLQLLPRPYPAYPARSSLNMVAIMPICDDEDGEHYAVVFPVVQFAVLESSHHYTLQIYRSDRQAWRTQVAQIADDTETRDSTVKMAIHYPTSVVHAGSGLLCWVDLWWGVLMCNVLDERPTFRFLAMPAVPEPCSTPSEFFVDFEIPSPRPYRQLTVHNGVMKFIELEYHHRGPTFSPKRRDDQGWMATTWTRPISSDVWQEGLTFDTSDISFANSTFLHLLPEILDQEKKLITWEKVMSGAPTPSLRDDDIVYIMVRMGLYDPTVFVLTVNTRSMMLESCAQCSGERMIGLEATYVPSLLSGYFGVTTCVLS